MARQHLRVERIPDDAAVAIEVLAVLRVRVELRVGQLIVREEPDMAIEKADKAALSMPSRKARPVRLKLPQLLAVVCVDRLNAIHRMHLRNFPLNHALFD